MEKISVSLRDVQLAAQKLAKVVYCTPLELNHTFSKMSGTDLYLKLENLQRTGSFKVRGAANCIDNLAPEKKACGVITASAGNHAQGVARAATELGIKATIVMPEAAPLAKIEATRGYGAEVVLAGADYDAAQAAALLLQEKTGATFVHAYDHPDVIAGQGTIGLELLKQCADLDTIVVPVGGGGLLAGIAVAIKETNPKIKVYGVQAAGASAMYLSAHAHKWVATPEANTIADGIAVKKPGKLNFEIIEKYVDDLVVVKDEEIAATVLLMMERAKLITEGAGATALAGIINARVPVGKKTAAIISGGNIDVNMISRIIENGLVKSGRRMKIVTSLVDRPGELLKFISYIKEYRANIIYISHERSGKDLAIGNTLVEMDLEIRNHIHGEDVIAALRRAGYHVDFI